MTNLIVPTYFDEQEYLENNPDVLSAVNKGTLSSGWEHYISYGYMENRHGVPGIIEEKIKNIMQCNDTTPTPSSKLRKRVHGDEDLFSFFLVGKLAAFNIEYIIQHHMAPPADRPEKERNILDFGCGCGRVMRWYHQLVNGARIFGVDIDNEAINWCQHHLSQIGEFIRNEESPPLPFEDEFFDMVYSISVFTHLPEDMELMWLEELRRVTKKGGYLLLTFVNDGLLCLKKDEKLTNRNGFYFAEGKGTEGLPDFYQTSYHTIDYIQNNWSKFFKIEKIIGRGIANHQDVALCVKV